MARNAWFIALSHRCHCWLVQQCTGLMIFTSLMLALVTTTSAQESSTGILVRGGSVEASPSPVKTADYKAPYTSELDPSPPPARSGFDVQPATATSPATSPTETSTDKPQPLRLAAKSRGEKRAATSSIATKPLDSLITVGGSLCVVLSLFFGLAWLTRRGNAQRNATRLPGEVIEVLGKSPLIKGQDLQLVRIGGKLLLLCVTPTGSETLTEIDDPDEVDRLSAVCRRNNPGSVTAAFNQMLTSIGREPARGFTGSARTPNDRRGGVRG